MVYTDKPVRNFIQKYHVLDKLNEAICYQQILIKSLDYCFCDSFTSSVE